MKRKASAFVPRILLGTAVLGVIPLCALDGCSSGTVLTTGKDGEAQPNNDAQIIALAQQGFDSSVDDVQLIPLAQQGFDAAADAKDDG